MKKQYLPPSAVILKMRPSSPLALEQSIIGDWGPEGGEAGAKGSNMFSLPDGEGWGGAEEADEEDPEDIWDSSMKSFIEKNNPF